MNALRRGLERALAALIVAAGITVVAAGILAYGGPSPAGTSGPPPSAAGTPAGPSTSPSSSASAPAGGSPWSSATPGADGSASPSSVGGIPSRIVVPALRIDLGVYPSDYPGGEDYPLCGVSQYFVPGPDNASVKLGLPGQAGRTTYVYAHARQGMFLPLLQGSQVADGKAMLGDLVQVYTKDGRVYLYEIFRVKRHVRDFSLAAAVGADEQWLVMQTSEGPNYTYPKLQVAARLLNVQPADAAAIRPSTTPAPACEGG
jgi:hypothetical protein